MSRSAFVQNSSQIMFHGTIVPYTKTATDVYRIDCLKTGDDGKPGGRLLKGHIVLPLKQCLDEPEYCESASWFANLDKTLLPEGHKTRPYTHWGLTFDEASITLQLVKEKDLAKAECLELKIPRSSGTAKMEIRCVDPKCVAVWEGYSVEVKAKRVDEPDADLAPCRGSREELYG